MPAALGTGLPGRPTELSSGDATAPSLSGPLTGKTLTTQAFPFISIQPGEAPGAVLGCRHHWGENSLLHHATPDSGQHYPSHGACLRRANEGFYTPHYFYSVTCPSRYDRPTRQSHACHCQICIFGPQLTAITAGPFRSGLRGEAVCRAMCEEM